MCRLLSCPRILRGIQEETWTNGSPHWPKVGVGGGYVPSCMKRRKRERSFIFGFTKSHVSHTLGGNNLLGGEHTLLGPMQINPYRRNKNETYWLLLFIVLHGCGIKLAMILHVLEPLYFVEQFKGSL